MKETTAVASALAAGQNWKCLVLNGAEKGLMASGLYLVLWTIMLSYPQSVTITNVILIIMLLWKHDYCNKASGNVQQG